ncbi:hypothetical protein Tco_1325384 [Tanacetum coccineum]
MDDPNITMEEYIRLKEEKAQKRRKVFNWETAKYGRIWYDEDVHDLRSIENEFPAIVFNDSLKSGGALSREPTVSSLNDEIDFRNSFDDSDDEDYTIIFDKNLFSYKIISVNNLKTDLENDNEKVNMPSFPPPEPTDIQKGGAQGACIRLDLMAEGLSARMLMEHMDAQGVRLFTSRAWRRLFDIRGLLLRGARRRLRWRQFILALGLHTNEEMETVRFGAYWAESARDPILRLCHRLIALSIARRSQAPEKVTVTDLFYLRGLNVDSFNVPYLLARYLRLFTAGRKSRALICGGQFVARLAEHFGLLTEERLRGLIVIAPTLSVIDMGELVRLQICEEIDDTWAWVALGPERQPDAAAGAPEDAEDAPVVDEGGQAVSAPVQAPPPPPAAARTMPQRMARLEEDVHDIHGALAEQREVINVMARDFSRFTVWVASGIA